MKSTNLKKKIYNGIPLFSLIIVALTVRLINIHSYAEFLGDQGRDGLSIMTFWQEKRIPLSGPPNSTQQYQGPIYYYLIGIPFILFNFDPIAPTIFITILEGLTAAVLYILGKRLFGNWIGITVGLLYAISPDMILRSRIFWNPTAIPLFASLILLSMYQITQKKYRWFIALGLSTGSVVQLHYSGIAYVPITILFVSILFFLPKYRGSRSSLMKWSVVCVLSFILVLLPFLIFEFQNSFADIKGIFQSAPIVLSGKIPKHYMMFLAPFPFIIIGGIIFAVLKYSKQTAVIISLFFLLLSLLKLPRILENPRMDIPRTKYFVEKIVERSNREPFSFAVFSSPSFSDLHYRFYFEVANIQPEQYVTGSYNQLFLVCEKGDCPRGKKILTTNLLEAKCFDPICNQVYPSIELNKWKYTGSEMFQDAVIYHLKRK